MKILLHPRNDALPLGSSADLREIPSSVLPGSVITAGTTRRLPFREVRSVAIPGRKEDRQRLSIRMLKAA
jgi:hypothetical protein